MKYFFIFFPIIIFTGCFDTSIGTCKYYGYKGITLPTAPFIASTHCSNGVKTQDGKFYQTRDSEVPVDKSYYFEFASMKEVP